MTKPQVHQSKLEEHLENIISNAALLADSLLTREERRDKIVQECNTLRQILQEYIQCIKKKSSDENLNEKIQSIQTKTHDLRKQVLFSLALRSRNEVQQIFIYLFIISIINDHLSDDECLDEKRKRKRKRTIYKCNMFTSCLSKVLLSSSSLLSDRR
jgi:hypothetical protein